jgi:hypothetical protein
MIRIMLDCGSSFFTTTAADADDRLSGLRWPDNGGSKQIPDERHYNSALVG